jgi:hypothetical protein
MVLSVGTFNLNNLFSRFNYEAEVSELPEEDVVINSSTTFPVADPTAHRFRTYRGRLVLGKPAEERETIADRVLSMDADVLAVQEVEDIDTLKRFNAEDLGGRLLPSPRCQETNQRLRLNAPERELSLPEQGAHRSAPSRSCCAPRSPESLPRLRS